MSELPVIYPAPSILPYTLLTTSGAIPSYLGYVQTQVLEPSTFTLPPAAEMITGATLFLMNQFSTLPIPHLSDNTAVFYPSGADLIDGQTSVAVPAGSLRSMIVSNINNIPGWITTYVSSTAPVLGTNTALGSSAMQNNVTGINNSVLGTASGASIKQSNNTIVGSVCNSYSFNGNYCTTVGTSSLKGTGSANTGIGYDILYHLTTGSNNTVAGCQADGYTVGSGNTSCGCQSYLSAAGFNNVAMGAFTMEANYSGSNNVGVGGSVMNNLVTGNNNVAVGYASASYVNGNYNTVGGSYAFGNGVNSGNSIIGFSSTYMMVKGIMNTTLGNNSMNNTTECSGTTIVGANSSSQTTPPVGAVTIGSASSHGASFSTIIGYSSASTATGNYITTAGFSTAVDTSLRNNSVILGANTTTQSALGDGQLAIGSTAHPINVVTTARTGGSAPALPSNPVSYWQVLINNNQCYIPVYN